MGTWSGTPYFFLRAGKKVGFLHDAWRLQPQVLRWRRLAWNARECLATGEWGGFQFTRSFLDDLTNHGFQQSGFPNEIISHFPLLPSLLHHDVTLSFYIDATLTQLFEVYGVSGHISSRIIEEVIEREGEQYKAAARVVCMSRWAAASVRLDYKISPSKIFVVPAGANIDDMVLKEEDEEAPGTSFSLERPLRLGFIGKDWRRKGLSKVLQVAEVLVRRGIPTRVVAAGFAPREGPRHPLLQSLGFVDKRSDMQGFIRLIRSFHYGCLFSSAEAYGISNVECQRIGVPILALDVGGISDTVRDGTAFLFPPAATVEEIADAVFKQVFPSDSYRELRRRVKMEFKNFSWDVAVNSLQHIWKPG